jgi:hypothetical protein
MNPFQVQGTPIGSPLLGMFIPAVVFLTSFVLTWLLYRHFSRRPPEL